MAARPTPLIAGNWKMNGLSASLDQVRRLGHLIGDREGAPVDVLLCPPATLLAALARECSTVGIHCGGQDCHPEASGAHTGDISAPMLADAGARYVIVGHSERRDAYGETDELVSRKADAGLAAGLVPIICVGESEPVRLAGDAIDAVSSQLAASVPDTAAERECIIAYEPIWAIGTGRTPSLLDIEEMHASIRGRLAERFGARGETMRVLYGGSLKPANAKDILGIADVNGGLVGGASLLADDLFAIICAA